MKTAAWIISVLGVLVLSVTGHSWAQAPAPISPGSDDGTAVVISGCPSFSWAEVTEATGYKLAVFTYDAIERPSFYEDIEATQTPVLEHDIPVRALSWTPSADQGLCAGSYVWYVAAVQWGEVLEWSEGLVFEVDALAGLDAAAGKCGGLPAAAGEGSGESGAQSEDAVITGKDDSAAQSLEQVISSKVTKEKPLNSKEGAPGLSGSAALGPILMGTEGPSNTFYGQGAGSSIDGNRNATFIGADAGHFNTTGYLNTFIGNQTGYTNTTGSQNTFLGYAAGYSNTTGDHNTFIGGGAGYYNTTGEYNTFVGLTAGYQNTSGEDNTFIGMFAAYNNTTGDDNTFVGTWSGGANTTGSQNTFLGQEAGWSNTTGHDNTLIGRIAGYSNTTGYYNTFVGRSAGYHNTEGIDNTFLGMDAGYYTTTGSSNTFIGRFAGRSNTTGYNNTFVGRAAGYSNQTGNTNTFVGHDAGRQNVSGHANVLIGYKAGYNETGSNKLYIDNFDTASPLIYGEFDNNLVKIHGELQMIAAAGPSDKRLKKDIKPLQSSLNKIQALQGVSYQWKTEEYPKWGFKETKQIGLVAQNVEDVMPELVSTDSQGYKAVSYDKLTAVLVEAVKELKSENVQLKAEIDELRALIR